MAMKITDPVQTSQGHRETIRREGNCSALRVVKDKCQVDLLWIFTQTLNKFEVIGQFDYIKAIISDDMKELLNVKLLNVWISVRLFEKIILCMRDASWSCREEMTKPGTLYNVLEFF